MSKWIELKNYKEEEIHDDILQMLKLEPKDFDEKERLDLWRKKISGSKIKDITSRPLTTIAYLLGLITEDEWAQDIDVIPKMNLYRDHGKLMEDIIVDRFNTAIENEYKDDQDLLKLYDISVDSTSVKRVREIFAPRANEKYYVKADKRTLFRNANEHSNLLMLNIDGYTTNDDGTIRQLVEIKTKTGALGNDMDYQGYIKLHFDQITYYATLLGATHGATLLVDHHSRGMKIHTFSKREINNNWAVIGPMIKSVGAVVTGTRKGIMKDKIIEILEGIDWGDPKKELVEKEKLITSVKIMHKE